VKEEIVERLRQLNQEFYQSFSVSFSSTRERIQSGVRRLLTEMPMRGNLLDIGCGNGNLAVEWQKSGRKGFFLGLDFSNELVQIAQEKVISLPLDNDQKILFLSMDINNASWVHQLPGLTWQTVVLFSVLHHIPGEKKREQLLRTIHRIMPKDGVLFLSVWQVRNSQRLLKRIQPWLMADLNEDVVEPGDVLMDWRAECQNADGRTGLRYVHIFSEEELASCADKTGFKVVKNFMSDGNEGNLALYQKWEKILV
jgi:tRNA (cmo5U34)-methyltransferase